MLDCPVALRRGRLKHSWLENEVLNKTPEIVLALRREIGWPALQRFAAEAEQARALGDDVELGFSPAGLVDKCGPLSRLPEDQRRAIREAIHAAYLKCFDAPRAAERLREAATRVKSALSAFLDEWNKPDEAVSNTKLQACWRTVLDDAERLRNALEALPKGIVLP